MARPKRGEILSLTIDDLAFGGEGVGRADGYVVFVPGALQCEPEAISCICALGAGGGRCQKRG